MTMLIWTSRMSSRHANGYNNHENMDQSSDDRPDDQRDNPKMTSKTTELLSGHLRTSVNWYKSAGSEKRSRHMVCPWTD